MRAASTSLVLLAAACSGAPDDRWRRPELDVAPFAALDANGFPGAAAVLAGFAPCDDDPALRVGDAALFGVEIHRANDVERVLLRLEVRDLFTTTERVTGGTIRERPIGTYAHKVTHIDGKTRAERVETIDVDVNPVRVALTRFDADGREQQTSEATLFEQALATGLWPVTRTDATLQQHALATLCSSSLSDVAGDDAVLRELLFRVVERPSLWSIVTSLGIEVMPVWMPAADRSATIDVAPLSAAARPLTLMLLVNGDVVLWVDLLVTKPNGATMACGGIAGAIARHPKDAGRMAVVRLLATRRGPPPVTP